MLQAEIEQVQTKHSILLKDNDYFWKLIPSSREHHNFRLFHSEITTAQYTSLPVMTYWHKGLAFYKFAKAIPLLSKTEAKECLSDLVTKTATALQELHSLGFAHLDVRLPNICFIKRSPC